MSLSYFGLGNPCKIASGISVSDAPLSEGNESNQYMESWITALVMRLVKPWYGSEWQLHRNHPLTLQDARSMPQFFSSAAHICNAEGSRCDLISLNSLSPWYCVMPNPLVSYVCLNISDKVQPKTSPFNTCDLIWVNYKVVSQFSQLIFLSF